MKQTVGGHVSRRQFLAATAAGGATLLAGRLQELWGFVPPVPAALRTTVGVDAPWIEATFTQLQQLMASRELSSHQLTKAYLDRIGRLNPLLHAVIETNPRALGIAAQRDAERRRGIIRGPLHGVTILICCLCFTHSRAAWQLQTTRPAARFIH